MLWRQLLKRLLALDCASCEGITMSGNTVVTSQEHAARSEVAYNLLNGMNWLAVFIQLCKARLTCIHSPSTPVVSHRLLRSRLVGRRKRLQKPSMGTWYRGQVVSLHSPELSSHNRAEPFVLVHRYCFTHSVVGLQAQEIGLRPFSPWQVWSGHETNFSTSII